MKNTNNAGENPRIRPMLLDLVRKTKERTQYLRSKKIPQYNFSTEENKVILAKNEEISRKVRDCIGECNRIRNEIDSCFSSPRLIWSDSSKGRKAGRKVRSAIEQGTIERVELRISEADDIWGHHEW